MKLKYRNIENEKLRKEFENLLMLPKFTKYLICQKFSEFGFCFFVYFIYEPCYYTRVIGSGEVEGLDVMEKVCRPKVIYCVYYGFLVV